jgi:hypothetical protein
MTVLPPCPPVIQYHIGETWRIPFQANDNNGIPLNLSGLSTAQFCIIDIYKTIVLSVSTSDAITITDAVHGIGNILITPAMQTTAALTPRKAYKYELVVQTPALITVQAQGQFIVLPNYFLNV